MDRKVVSVIILCLMILGTLPLYSASAGTGEDSASTGTEKTAKAHVKNLEDKMQKKESEK
ncbi:MAG: hypothetical protein KKE04_03645 [Candidatus Thermoplasmatota archaeon]|nr:hypothetical protein [Candidatus Thermoplasmatota archaeon]